jgi:hypothetical protein
MRLAPVERFRAIDGDADRMGTASLLLFGLVRYNVVV